MNFFCFDDSDDDDAGNGKDDNNTITISYALLYMKLSAS